MRACVCVAVVVVVVVVCVCVCVRACVRACVCGGGVCLYVKKIIICILFCLKWLHIVTTAGYLAEIFLFSLKRINSLFGLVFERRSLSSRYTAMQTAPGGKFSSVVWLGSHPILSA